MKILKRISPMLMAEISQRVPDISDEDIEGHVCPMCDSGLVAELSAAKDWANVNVLSHVGEPESAPLTRKKVPTVSCAAPVLSDDAVGAKFCSQTQYS